MIDLLPLLLAALDPVSPAPKIEPGNAAEWATLAWVILAAVFGCVLTGLGAWYARGKMAGKHESNEENLTKEVGELKEAVAELADAVSDLRQTVGSLQSSSACIACRKEVDAELANRASRGSVKDAFDEIRAQEAKAAELRETVARIDERLGGLSDGVARLEFKLDRALEMTPRPGQLPKQPTGGHR